MSKKYDEIMEHIAVTPEMHQRVISNIHSTNFLGKNVSKVIRLPRIKPYISVAACLAVILIGAITVPTLIHQSPVDTPPPVLGQSGIVDVATLAELNAAVQFEVAGLCDLPFEVDATTYTAYWRNVAQITYKGATQTAIYRKGIGSDDVSGDYTVYDTEAVLKIATASVTLKGNSDGFTLAIWTDGDYSYSVQLTSGIPKADWEALLDGVVE